MLNRKSLMTLAAFALAAFAGAALAAPDLFHAAIALLVNPHTGLALAFSPVVLKLQREHAEHIDGMKALAATMGERELSAEEQAKFDGHQAKAASLKARIEQVQAAELAEAGLDRVQIAQATAAASSVGNGRAVALPAGALMSVEENIDKDPKRGFKTLGDLGMSVFNAWRISKTGVGAMDQRLSALLPTSGMPLAAAPSSFSGEGAGADGGFLVPPEFSTNVFDLSLTEDSMLPYTDNMPVQGNGIAIPKDEATPWGTNGPRAYWQGEAGAGTPTKAALQLLELRLKKMLALTPVSDELLSDSIALGAYLPKRMALSLRWKANEAILFGLGNGTPLGALNGPSVITHAKDSGQAANTLSVANLLGMFSRLPPGSYSNAIWLINNTVIPALGGLTLGNYPIFLPVSTPAPGGGIQPALQWTLLGRPVIITQHANAFSAQGDVCLVDLNYYQTITKSEGVQTATSMHLYFDADATAFRVTFRMDGAPKLSAPIQPAKGSTTLSPFVQLQAR